MSYDYYYNQEVEQHIHYQIPLIMFRDEQLCNLSINAKFLYSVLFDRAKLSFKNGLIDNDGRVYIRYSQSDLTELLNCGRTKISEYFKELDAAKGGVGLIERKQKVGIGKSDIIYVKRIDENQSEKHEKQSYNFFYDMSGLRFRYLQVPKNLFTEEKIKSISNIAKMAYCFLLDRMSLSYKNNWRDKSGRSYVLFPQKELQKILRCSEKTVRKALNELDTKNGIGLIDRKHQGINNPDMIYVLDFSSNLKNNLPTVTDMESNETVESFQQNVENDTIESTVNIGAEKSEHLDRLDRKNLNIGAEKSEHLDRKNLNIGAEKSEHHIYNNTNINNTNINNPNSVYQSKKAEKNLTSGQIDRQIEEKEKIKFSDILAAIGYDYSYAIGYEPLNENDGYLSELNSEERKTQNCTIPYYLKSNKQAMREAIKFLFAYSYNSHDRTEESMDHSQ